MGEFLDNYFKMSEGNAIKLLKFFMLANLETLNVL